MCAIASGRSPTPKPFQQSRRERKKVEMRFAHMKRILKFDRLRLRGLSGAKEEVILTATAQNLRRLAKLLCRAPPPQAAACLAQASCQALLTMPQLLQTERGTNGRSNSPAIRSAKKSRVRNTIGERSGHRLAIAVHVRWSAVSFAHGALREVCSSVATKIMGGIRRENLASLMNDRASVDVMAITKWSILGSE
jgi:hypothetical protein